VRCPQCQFENIPGQERCLRCSAVLQAEVVAGPVNPPRMARWKGPIRGILRWLRLRRVLPEVPAIPPRVPAFLKIMSADAFLGLILSIIPGLAHYIDGRFREVRWFVLGWFLALLAGAFFYGGGLGFLLLGFAVGLHGWIAFHYAQSKEQDEIPEKFRTLALLLVACGLLYWGIRAVAFRDFVFGYTNLTIPYQNVRAGDLLLARRSLSRAANLHRGSLVLAPVANVWGGHGPTLRRGPLMVGQIIGLAGEEVRITSDVFVVDGQVLDGERFPVPQWLRKQKIGVIRVPDGSYFLSAEYNVNVHGNAALDARLLELACLVRSFEVEGRAIMRWFPVARRGFLRADQ
jgi:hypothetical protein